MALDQYGRRIHYLRISLTDQCNLRCVYCMPEDMQFRPTPELMQDDEVVRLASLFARLGFNKIRLTGGEPTIRENVVEVVRRLAALPGVEELAMTTNGILLKHLALPLVRAGLRRINVSLDTLNPERFRRLTRWGNVDDVWNGVHASESAGLGVKLNAVVVRGFNDGEDVIDLARLTLSHPWQIRFIEMMPLGRIADFQQANVVTELELREHIARHLGPLQPLNDGALDGEARVYRLKGAAGSLGFISSVTNPFCAACNRVRLTADGRLRLCLLRDREVNLLSFLRDGASDEEILDVMTTGVWHKPWGHGLAQQVHPETRVMSEIGG